MKSVITTCLVGASFVTSLHACDSCAIAIASGDWQPGFFTSVSEQFTRLATLRLDGHKVPNELGQLLDSSITHFNLGYSNGDRLAYQLTVPYVYRRFRRPEGDSIERGTESGLGDATLAVHYVLARGVGATTSWDFGVLAGIKFATGSAERIAEELNESDEAGGESSGIHGHDLTLGSGSTDGLLGVDGRWTDGRFLVAGSLQYSVRSPGKFDYRFANELLWNATAGWYPVLTHERSLGVAGVLSGESKGKDTFAGEAAEDTGLHAVYLGPRLTLSGTNRWSAELELAWPISQHNTSLQAVADYRWRAGATWRF